MEFSRYSDNQYYWMASICRYR